MGARETDCRRRRESGQGAVEYGLIVALGAVVVVAALLFLAGSVDRVLRRAGTSTEVFRPPVVQCHSSYEGVCLPPTPPDLDCGDLEARGIPLPVRVVGPDPHGLDPDHDGFGC